MCAATRKRRSTKRRTSRKSAVKGLRKTGVRIGGKIAYVKTTRKSK